MSVTYFISASEQIINYDQAITCPACRTDRGIRLTTSGAGHPVTGSCPNDHIWDERHISGATVQRLAIKMYEENR